MTVNESGVKGVHTDVAVQHISLQKARWTENEEPGEPHLPRAQRELWGSQHATLHLQGEL